MRACRDTTLYTHQRFVQVTIKKYRRTNNSHTFTATQTYRLAHNWMSLACEIMLSRTSAWNNLHENARSKRLSSSFPKTYANRSCYKMPHTIKSISVDFIANESEYMIMECEYPRKEWTNLFIAKRRIDCVWIWASVLPNAHTAKSQPKIMLANAKLSASRIILVPFSALVIYTYIYSKVQRLFVVLFYRMITLNYVCGVLCFCHFCYFVFGFSAVVSVLFRFTRRVD